MIARGNRRQAIFEDENDWRRLDAAIRTAAATGALDLCAYCLMPNHLHILLRCPEEPVSRALHPILTSHAVYMNKKYQRTGHLFQDRFKTFPCIDDGRAKDLIRYIHNNPVRARLVERAADWTWSSHLDYLGTRAEGSLTLEFGLSLFADSPVQARRSYAAFMADAVEPPSDGDEGRPSLEALASHAERCGGHQPGFLRARSRNPVAAKLRARFIMDALSKGYRPGDLALFLGMAESVVNWARRQC